MGLAVLDIRTATTSLQAAGDRTETLAVRLRVKSFLCASLLLIIVGNLGRVPVLDGGEKEAPLLFTDVVVIGLVIAGLAAAARNRKLAFDRPAQLAIGFALVGALSAALAIPRFDLSAFQFFFSIAYLLRWVLYFVIYLLAINLIQRKDVGDIWRALETGILIFAGFGVIQSLFLPGFAQIVQPDAAWDEQGHRLVSSFLDPNFAGAFVMLGLLVLLAKLSMGEAVAPWKIVLLSAALLMTLSRSSILATMVGTFLIFGVRGLSVRLLRVAGLILLLLIPALPALIEFANSFGRFSLEGSGAQRLIVWLQALEMIRDHPIIGIGFNTYGYVQEYYNHAAALGGFHYFSLDGGLLFITVMTGAVGVVLYGAMLVGIYRRSRRVARSADATPEERGLALGVAAITVAIVVHSLFVNSLLLTLLMQPLWVLWALPRVIERSTERAPVTSAPKRAAPALVSLASTVRT